MQASDQETVSEQAQRWVVRLASGEMTADEMRTFETWVGQSDAHEQAFADERRFWQRLSVLDRTFDELDPEQHEASALDRTTSADRRTAASERAMPSARRGRMPAREETRRRPRRRARQISAFVGIGFALCLLTYFAGPQLYTTVWAHHSSGYDRTKTVTLADGSRVTLNRDSAIRVTFRETERRIDLLEGEIFVEVEPNAARPFRIHSDQGISEAVGTAYAVRCLNDKTRVAVTEGQVAVTTGTKSGHAISLRAGEGIRYADGRFLGGVFALPDQAGSDALAWRQGKAIFVDRPIADVLSELERYHRGRILLLGKRDRYQRVSGVIDLDRLADGVTALAATHGLRAVHLTPYLTVIR